MTHDKPQPTDYASPPCYAQELDPLYRDLGSRGAATWKDVSRWRQAERERLLALRADCDDNQRADELRSVLGQLDELLQTADVAVLGVYWPIQQELDLRTWMRKQATQGLTIALPVIVAEGEPLRYSRWQPGAPMRRGHWGIAEPAQDDWVEPQVVLAPLVGVDERNFRLGNGGGYFDRSLAAWSPRPRVIGVGFRSARIATIYPQAHDIPMDRVITA